MRIHGAMIEAVARSDYRGVSVKQVIALAGVSRRSFYEQFENKQDCFLATFDLIAQREVERIRESYRVTRGGIDERLLAVFGSFVDAASAEPNAPALVMVDAQTAGVAGTLRLRRATGACEEMLSLSFAHSSSATALPAPIVRAITGGLHGAVATRLRRGLTAGDTGRMAEEMLTWTLASRAVDGELLARHLLDGMRRRSREIAFAERKRARGQGPPQAHAEKDERVRLMRSVLRLVSGSGYDELTAPQIADEARLSIDVFFEHFADRDECFLAALQLIGDELLSAVADPSLRSGEWPLAVRRSLSELLGLIGGRPRYARALIHDSCSARPDTFEWSLTLAQSLAEALVAGAPEPPAPLIVEAIAGAIWHTIRCQVAGGRIALLPAVSDYLSYVVLGACIGAPAAAEALHADI
ncbi:MAG TPA: TetR/AcrR family transcriptional regulator [Solirubrobacteraceae bacterium]|jgi:AcrR family transcriptional regulator